MTLPIRKAVRVLLINNNNQLLLMCVEDFDVSTPDGTRNKRFWCTIGGGIERGESIEQAALREIYEETGIVQEAVALKSVVWHGVVDLMLKGVLTRLDESFIVAKTNQTTVALCSPTEDEKQVVKKMIWFSLEDIQKCPDVIFPVVLPDYLPDILSGNYPQESLYIDLAKKPK